jgi:hypothetical protein
MEDKHHSEHTQTLREIEVVLTLDFLCRIEDEAQRLLKQHDRADDERGNQGSVVA